MTTEAANRRVQRVHLPTPVIARFGTLQGVLLDVSLLGAKFEHPTALTRGGGARLGFAWNDEAISTDARIVWTRLERFTAGPDGMTIYHSGLEFTGVTMEAKDLLKNMLEQFITRALYEQKLNARGVLPTAVENMPIFRGSQLTANRSDVIQAVGSSVLPTARMAKHAGYVCYLFANRQWKKKRTQDPAQPEDGFTISASEDVMQAQMLCAAYEKSDVQGRRMIQLFAQLSIIEGEGIAPGRFEP
jgi:PilZ domain